ncbi:MAG: ATP-dependent DNA ligase, partial [Planctomycetota bacterium]|nr:ATP-dependent DNA ligase [Planctomycetota bacterium]
MARRTIGRHAISTSNEDKPLFGEDGPTKGDLIDYYERIADRMLPHLRDRVLSMHRFPDGVDSEGFYQKKAPDYFPDFFERHDVKTSEGTQRQLVC